MLMSLLNTFISNIKSKHGRESGLRFKIRNLGPVLGLSGNFGHFQLKNDKDNLVSCWN